MKGDWFSSQFPHCIDIDLIVQWSNNALVFISYVNNINTYMTPLRIK